MKYLCNRSSALRQQQTRHTRTMKLLYLVLSTIFIAQRIPSVDTLICAHACSFGPVQFGTTAPIRNPCQTREINATSSMCTVLLTVNFETSLIGGTLNDKTRLTDQSSSLLLSHIIYPNEVLIFITYACSTNDHCDEEFVNETVSSSGWLTMNETKFRADLAALAFGDRLTPVDVLCGNNQICKPGENCYATFSRNRSIASNVVSDFANQYPCNHEAGGQILFKQHFYTSVKQREEMLEVYCNRDDCIKEEKVSEVYRLFKDEFKLPLNYSSYNYVEPGNRAHRRNFSIAVCIMFFLLTIG